MSIKITQQHSEAYKVNGKGVIRNEMGIWIAPFHTLEPIEWDAFHKHLQQTESDNWDDCPYSPNKAFTHTNNKYNA